MAEFTEVVFILNNTNRDWRGRFRLQDFSAPAGKALRFTGDGDDKVVQFTKSEADLFIDILPPEMKPCFTLSRTKMEMDKDEIVPAPRPTVETPAVQNAPGMDYPDWPDGIPEMDTTREQVLAWLRDHDEGMLKEVLSRPKLTVEDIVLKIWKAIDPARAKKYLKRKGA